MNTKIDINNEFIIARHDKGIKLVVPDKNNKSHNQLTVGELFELPLNTYFLGENSSILEINDETLAICGYPEKRKTIGKTIHIAVKKKYADSIVIHDQEVIRQKRMIIKDDFIERLDDVQHAAVSVKMPFYEEDKIAGVFGISVILNYHSMAGAFDLFSKLKLFSENKMENLNISKVEDIYLSPRESQCVDLLLTGKTMKMIAKVLSLSPRTIEHYVESIKYKLGVESKAELIEKIMTSHGVNSNTLRKT